MIIMTNSHRSISFNIIWCRIRNILKQILQKFWLESKRINVKLITWHFFMISGIKYLKSSCNTSYSVDIPYREVKIWNHLRDIFHENEFDSITYLKSLASLPVTFNVWCLWRNGIIFYLDFKMRLYQCISFWLCKYASKV